MFRQSCPLPISRPLSRRRRMRGLGRAHAQAVVEFALVLPLLLFLLVGLIELGIVLQAQIILTNAAWEGARAGALIVDPIHGDAEILAAVHRAALGLDPARLATDIDPAQDEPPRCDPWPAPRGATLRVAVIYRLPLAIPPIVLPLAAEAVTRIEYQNP